ncbi:MAG: YidC/Oxa1 family membrane protein insertase [Candidatus Shapirobacteria bacterium]
MNLFISPFVNALMWFYELFGNLGWSVITVTVLIKLVLFPIIWPSLKSAKKMTELQPRLKKLQEKYGKDKEGLAKAQMDFYKQEGINPLSGCLPNLLQVAVLIVFFSAFNLVLGVMEGKKPVTELNSHLIPMIKVAENFKFNQDFIGMDLATTPAKLFGAGFSFNWILVGILLLGSALLQYFSSKLMMPAVKTDETIIKETKDKEDDIMSAMRTQSLYMMPAMTVFIGWSFSIGMLLYWFVNSAVMLGQQLLANKQS